MPCPQQTQVSQPPPVDDKWPPNGKTPAPPLFTSHKHQSLQQEPAFRASSLRFALPHPQLPVAFRRLGRSGQGELRPAYGVEASGPSAVPGAVAVPPLLKRCLSLAATPHLRHSMMGKDDEE